MKITMAEKLKVFRNFIIELPLDLLAFVIVPIVLLFCGKNDQRLPRWARWFDEERYGINAEILDGNGKVLYSDEGHCGENGRFPRPKNRTWYARVRWLLRNRIGVFTSEIMGVKFKDIDPTTIKVWGDDNTPSYSGRGGTTWGLVRAKTFSGKHIFGYFGNICRGKYFYVRIFLGHKIFDISHIAKEKDNTYKLIAMCKFLDNPQSKEYAKSVCAIHPMRLIKT